jgi:hypothetical protein
VSRRKTYKKDAESEHDCDDDEDAPDAAGLGDVDVQAFGDVADFEGRHGG